MMSKSFFTLFLLLAIFKLNAQPPRGGGGFDMSEMVTREKEMVLTKVTNLSEDQKLLVTGIYDEFAVTVEETVAEIRQSGDYSQFRTKMPLLREEKDLLLKDVFNEAQFTEYKEITTANGLGFRRGQRPEDNKTSKDSTDVPQ